MRQLKLISIPTPNVQLPLKAPPDRPDSTSKSAIIEFIKSSRLLGWYGSDHPIYFMWSTPLKSLEDRPFPEIPMATNLIGKLNTFNSFLLAINYASTKIYPKTHENFFSNLLKVSQSEIELTTTAELLSTPFRNLPLINTSTHHLLCIFGVKTPPSHLNDTIMDGFFNTATSLAYYVQNTLPQILPERQSDSQRIFPFSFQSSFNSPPISITTLQETTNVFKILKREEIPINFNIPLINPEDYLALTTSSQHFISAENFNSHRLQEFELSLNSQRTFHSNQLFYPLFLMPHPAMNASQLGCFTTYTIPKNSIIGFLPCYTTALHRPELSPMKDVNKFIKNSFEKTTKTTDQPLYSYSFGGQLILSEDTSNIFAYPPQIEFHPKFKREKTTYLTASPLSFINCAKDIKSNNIAHTFLFLRFKNSEEAPPFIAPCLIIFSTETINPKEELLGFFGENYINHYLRSSNQMSLLSPNTALRLTYLNACSKDPNLSTLIYLFKNNLIDKNWKTTSSKKNGLQLAKYYQSISETPDQYTEIIKFLTSINVGSTDKS